MSVGEWGEGLLQLRCVIDSEIRIGKRIECHVFAVIHSKHNLCIDPRRKECQQGLRRKTRCWVGMTCKGMVSRYLCLEVGRVGVRCRRHVLCGKARLWAQNRAEGKSKHARARQDREKAQHTCTTETLNIKDQTFKHINKHDNFKSFDILNASIMLPNPMLCYRCVKRQ